MLVLARDAYDAILEHAQADVPREACGLLVGEDRNDERVVEAVRRVPNIADTPRMTYELDPEAVLAVFDEAEATRRDVVGFYHSHPAGPANMSPTDCEKAHWPDHVYLLASLAARPPVVDAWLWTGENFEREDVVVR